MKNTYLIFDIETKALPVETIKAMGLMPPFRAPGNFKDPEKIKAKELEHEADVMDKAAVDPLLSTICAVGFIEGDDCEFSHFEGTASEVDMLVKVWSKMRICLNDMGRIVGFNSHGFDLPYLIVRSWILDVPICDAVKKGNWWSGHSFDLAEMFKLGRKDTYVSLDRLARAMNVGMKSGSGKDFAALLESEPAKAVEYLRNDLMLTLKVAQRMGVVDI